MDRNELIISLIRDDLVNNKLMHGLIEIGLAPKNYILHLSETILKLIGFEDNAVTDEIYAYYLDLTRKAKYLDIKNSYDQLTKVAEEIYHELRTMKNYLFQKNENNCRNERRLKVYSKYLSRETTAKSTILPEIRLCGKWLSDIGFDYGRSILVAHEKNKIIITLSP